MIRCSSCGTEVKGVYVEFGCPNCSESEIIRCDSCRVLGTKYSCNKCAFVGP